MRRYTLALCLIIGSWGAALQSQTVTDALRYSMQDVLGTARNISVGGSMGAIGADFSAMSLNPAGVAAFRKSEFMLTPAIFGTKTESTLSGEGNAPYDESVNKLVLSNLGFVVTSVPRSAKWKTSNFAIGINRIGDFNQSFFYEGRSVGSITDRFLEFAIDKRDPDKFNAFEEGLAYATGAIYYKNDMDGNQTDTLISDYSFNNAYPLLKEQYVMSEGSLTEISFSYGANMDEKLLIGFSVAAPIFNFREDKRYYETDDDSDEVPMFNDLLYEEYLTTTGYGFQFKAGVIYKPTPGINVGFSFHTPTGFVLTDDYYNSMEYSYTEEGENYMFEAESPDGSFEYKLKTPWRVQGGLGVIIMRSGFLSAEVQWVDYSAAEFNYRARGNGNAFVDEEREVNRQISNALSDAVTLKVGGEWAHKKFRARAGVNLQQSPYESDSSFEPTYTAGIGIREDQFYIDMAMRLDKREEGYYPYLTANAPQQFVTNDVRKFGLFITAGFKF